MKTLGGYEITNFKKLKKPKEVQKGILLPILYSGRIYDPISKVELDIHWNTAGKCSNYARKDCFIDLNDLNEPKTKEHELIMLFRKHRKMNWPWEYVEKEGAINHEDFIKAIKEYDKSRRNKKVSK